MERIRRLNYQVLTFDLNTARSDEPTVLAGVFDHLAVALLDGNASIRLNEKTKDSIDLTYIQTIDTLAFDRFYLTNITQGGRTLILYLGATESQFSVRTSRSPRASNFFVNNQTTGQVTTNAYATCVQINFGGWDRLLMQLSESAGQNVMYSLDASIDGSLWTNLKTNVDLLASGTQWESLTDLWPYVRIQIIDKFSGTHGTVTVKYVLH
jgi:hypothetical protein